MTSEELLSAIGSIYPEFLDDLEQAYLVHDQLSRSHGIFPPGDDQELNGDDMAALGELLADVELTGEGAARAELVQRNIRAISFIERFFEVLVERRRAKETEAVTAAGGDAEEMDEAEEASIIPFPGTEQDD